MTKKTIGVRVDEDTYSGLEVLAERIGFNLSEATRQAMPTPDQLSEICRFIDSDPSLNFKHFVLSAIQDKIIATRKQNDPDDELSVTQGILEGFTKKMHTQQMRIEKLERTVKNIKDK